MQNQGYLATIKLGWHTIWSSVKENLVSSTKNDATIVDTFEETSETEEMSSSSQAVYNLVLAKGHNDLWLVR